MTYYFMDEDPFSIRYVIFIILLFLSFYFSGSETAIFSLTKLEQNTLKKTKAPRMKMILSFLLSHQEQLLITILTANMVVNVFVSSLGELIGDRIFSTGSEVFSIIGMTLILLIVGELTPKRIAVNHSKGFTRMVAVPLYYLHIFLSPVRKILHWVTQGLMNRLPNASGGSSEHKHAIVLSTAELGYHHEILNQSEFRLFKSYITFKEKTAHGIMTPRSELKTVSYDTPLGEVLELIGTDPSCIMNSSVLLFEEDNDHLYGWVGLAALLQRKFSKDGLDKPVGSLAEKFYVVPDSKDLSILINELREADADVVQLVDEYGGTAGVVWFRNIIEDVLKAFYAPGKDKFEDLAEDSIAVPGSMTPDEFQELFGMYIETDADTMAGYFLDLRGEIPQMGDKVKSGSMVFTVLSMDGNKIESLRMEVTGE